MNMPFYIYIYIYIYIYKYIESILYCIHWLDFFYSRIFDDVKHIYINR